MQQGLSREERAEMLEQMSGIECGDRCSVRGAAANAQLDAGEEVRGDALKERHIVLKKLGQVDIKD